MDATDVSRRKLLSSASLLAGASLLTGCGEAIEGAPSQEKIVPSKTAGLSPVETKASNGWQYVQLDPAAVAADAYGLMAQGGCMYGVFASVLAAMAQRQGEPYRSFPIHMMKHGEGGVGLWGSLCGTVNAGAAIIGLFTPEKEQREQLIAELFSWYERTQLPIYRLQQTSDPSPFPTSVAGSVLCHVSAGKWCKTTGDEIGSAAMKERCRRLTADVAGKTVELLNGTLQAPCQFAGLNDEVKSCMSCHGQELHDTIGKMQCTTCHQQLSKKHPSVPAVSPKATMDPPSGDLPGS